jgi:tetratricopeptide (TPR) repeat protein
MLDIVAELPSDTIGLYGASFDRAEELFGRDFAVAFLGLIAVGRSGWRESDFRGLLSRLAAAPNMAPASLLRRLLRGWKTAPRVAPWDELRFASLRRLFRGQIRQRGTLGQWDFNHALMRAAACQRVAQRRIPERIFHVEVATHLLALPPDDPLRISETMVHLLGGEDWTRAAGYYGDSGLTGPEIAGATRVLADGVLGMEGKDDRLRPILRLLDVGAVGQPDLASSVVHRFIFSVDGELEGRANLVTRFSLINAAHTTLARLALVDNGNAKWVRGLSLSEEKIGDLLFDRGDLPAALNRYQTSLSITERLVTRDPQNATWQRDLSLSHARVGDVFAEQGELPAALASYQAALGIAERLANDSPEDAKLQSDLSLPQGKIGDVLVEMGNLPAALSSYQASLLVTERLAVGDPKNAARQRDLSVSHSQVGDVLVEMDNLPAALTTYQLSLAISERLARADPGYAGWQYDIASCKERIGNVLMKQSNLPEALKCFQARYAIIERLTKEDPGNAIWHRDLSVAHQCIGDVLREQGDLRAALDSYRASLAVSERLAKTYPETNDYLADVAASKGNIGLVHERMGQNAEALVMFRNGRAIIRLLAERAPNHKRWNSYLANFDRDISRLEQSAE